MALKPSLRLCLWLVMAHAAAALVLSVTALPLWARFAMLQVVLFSLVYYLARDAFLWCPDSWCEICHEHGNFFVLTRAGARFGGKIARRTTVTPHFLCIGLDGHRSQRVIFADALDKEAYRELCVQLTVMAHCRP